MDMFFNFVESDTDKLSVESDDLQRYIISSDLFLLCLLQLCLWRRLQLLNLRVKLLQVEFQVRISLGMTGVLFCVAVSRTTVNNSHLPVRSNIVRAECQVAE